MIILRANLITEPKRKLVFTRPDYYAEVIKKLNPKYPVTVEIKNEIPRRSEKQLRYLWGVCYPVISEYTGDTVEEIHELMKVLFAPTKHYTHKGIDIEVPKSTKTMNKTECAEFITKIINHAGQDLGLTILSPCEAGYFCMKPNCIVCQKEMKKLG